MTDVSFDVVLEIVMTTILGYQYQVSSVLWSLSHQHVIMSWDRKIQPLTGCRICTRVGENPDPRSLLIGQKLDLIKGVCSKIRLYVRTFNIIPDPTQKIYQEMFVMDGVPDFHPP